MFYRDWGRFNLPRTTKTKLSACTAVLILVLFYCLSGDAKKKKNNEQIPDSFEISPERKLVINQRAVQNLLRNDLESQKTATFYLKRPETRHVDCGRVLNGDKEYTTTLTGLNRTFLIENPHLNMSCPALLGRINPFPELLKPLKMGVAFARIVYKDYEFLERQVQTSYHPQNFYCFAVDRKSAKEFQNRIRKLVDCLPNAVLLPILYNFDSSGHNYNLANHLCMREVLKVPGWNYLLLLQNHDVIMKSIYEIERIYELLGGANDIEVQPEEGRIDWKFRWDPRSLGLFINESEIDPRLLDIPMKMAKGDSQASVSRGAVDWLVNRVNLTKFIDQWNTTEYGNDEQFLSSFQINAEFGMPGHFTDECVSKGIHTWSISRLCQWTPYDSRICSTKTKRHGICVVGIEDLRMIAQFPNLMVNKMLPSFDYSIVDCTAELLHNRTFLGQVDHPLEDDYYRNMVHVLYHKNRKNPDYKLNCTSNYTTWAQLPYPF